MQPVKRRSLTFVLLLAVGSGLMPATPSAAETPFSLLAGTWSGGGQIRLDDGRSERLSCRAYYTPKDGGASLTMAIRCASTSYKIELRSAMSYQAGRISGTWEERSFNAAGSLTGRAANGSVSVAFSGNISGSMSVSYGSTTQKVQISANGGGLSGVSLNLSKG